MSASALTLLCLVAYVALALFLAWKTRNRP